MDREHILAGMKVVQKVFEKETERDIEKTIAREGAMNIPG
jgi:hypothetical protein